MRVNGGVGNMLMGPLEINLSGPYSVLGMPLVIWMEAIHNPNRSTINSLNGDSNRMLGCATIMPTDRTHYSIDDY